MTDDLVKRLRERQRRTQMTEDLVKRLRDRDAYAKSNGNDYNLDNQAADRIEVLEAALQKIAKHDMQAIAIDALSPGKRIRVEDR